MHYSHARHYIQNAGGGGEGKGGDVQDHGLQNKVFSCIAHMMEVTGGIKMIHMRGISALVDILLSEIKVVEQRGSASLRALTDVKADHPMILSEDALSRTVQLLRSLQMATQENAPASVQRLAESPQMRSNLLEADSLPGLISLLASPSASAADNSISALFTLAFDRTAVHHLVEFAGISALILMMMIR